MLLTRDAFREGVFARDNHKCVFCDLPAVDAHHIMERRLWPDGGYYLDNGASVCGTHHLSCEMTTLSPDDVRRAAGITKVILPPHLYNDQEYDKWGNPFLPNGMRLRGELFYDESVQKVLDMGGYLGGDYFTDYVKYPRTYHLPWSDNITDDDRVMSNLVVFIDKQIVVTEKMDGENTTMYRDYIHARSVDGRSHPSRDWVKNFWHEIACDIPEGWRICGENLYAKHSIGYGKLPSYFMGFSVWNEKNICLSWTDTQEWFKLLGIQSVPVIYEGGFGAGDNIQDALEFLWCGDVLESEGYVMRIANEIPYVEFRTKVGKYVRKDHVQTVKHWMHGQRIEKNSLCLPKN